jgi:histidinol-phosphate aminotransferase
MAASAYLSRGKRLVLATPTYDPIAGFAVAQGAEIKTVPLNARRQHDLDSMLARIGPSTSLVYICNPNNPTGTITPRKDLEVFLGKIPSNTTVVIDEAYHDYVAKSTDYASFIDSPISDERLIMVRTFSKIYGLAGLRVGYSVASPKASQELRARSLQWGVNTLGARAAATALEDQDFVAKIAKQNRDDRQEFFNQSNARMLRWIDSLTNFVMLNGGLPPQQIVDHFLKNGILLGPLIPEMPKFVRCSLGTRTEMLEFWRAWDSLPLHPMAM